MSLVDLTGRDVRALTIFASYLLACVSLVLLICHDLYRKHRNVRRAQPTKASLERPAPAVLLFAVLAAVCLCITWFYMLSFFGHSYNSWAERQSFATHASRHQSWSDASWIVDKRIGDWLKDVQLFRDAWETALQSPGCLFWAQPIFFITAAWSLYISKSARSRQIPHAWAYMLLGQIVAISFAQNLFFLAVLIYRPTSDDKQYSPRMLHSLVHVLVPLLTIPSVALIPTYTHGPYFLPLLMIPHLALMLPPLSVALSGPSFDDERRTRSMYRILCVAAVALQVKVAATALWEHAPNSLSVEGAMSASVWQTPQITSFIRSLIAALKSHPAVSSVGSDVLLCLANTALWAIVSPDHTTRTRLHKKSL